MFLSFHRIHRRHFVGKSETSMARTQRKILVFGNPMLKEDSLQLRILGRLRKRFPDIDFKELDPNDNLEEEGRNLEIIDCAAGISRVVVVTDTERLVTSKVYSMHDFDLAQSLKLLKKMGYLDSVRIFCVPQDAKEDDAFRQLSALISSS